MTTWLSIPKIYRIDELGKKLDNIQQTDISVLDLSKAYDKVSHQLLPIKLLLH